MTWLAKWLPTIAIAETLGSLVLILPFQGDSRARVVGIRDYDLISSLGTIFIFSSPSPIIVPARS